MCGGQCVWSLGLVSVVTGSSECVQCVGGSGCGQWV